jgi:hypothetical protein
MTKPTESERKQLDFRRRYLGNEQGVEQVYQGRVVQIMALDVEEKKSGALERNIHLVEIASSLSQNALDNVSKKPADLSILNQKLLAVAKLVKKKKDLGQAIESNEVAVSLINDLIGFFEAAISGLRIHVASDSISVGMINGTILGLGASIDKAQEIKAALGGIKVKLLAEQTRQISAAEIAQAKATKAEERLFAAEAQKELKNSQRGSSKQSKKAPPSVAQSSSQALEPQHTQLEKTEPPQSPMKQNPDPVSEEGDEIWTEVTNKGIRKPKASIKHLPLKTKPKESTQSEVPASQVAELVEPAVLAPMTQAADLDPKEWPAMRKQVRAPAQELEKSERQNLGNVHKSKGLPREFYPTHTAQDDIMAHELEWQKTRGDILSEAHSSVKAELGALRQENEELRAAINPTRQSGRPKSSPITVPSAASQVESNVGGRGGEVRSRMPKGRKFES